MLSPRSLPPHDAASFYATRRGRRTADLLAARLTPLLPSPAGRRILGLGYPRPILDRWPGLDQARWVGTARLNAPLTRRAPSADPSGVAPQGLSRRDCVVSAEALPFDDLSLDCVLMLHGLEFAGNAPLLRAIWKALADDGQLVLIVPNRTGFWAHDESTPFGHGLPYSAGQLDRLLARALFRPEATRAALAVPPVALRTGRRAAAGLDRIACWPGRQFGGVHIVVARKDLYAGLPLTAEPAGLARTVMGAGLG
ncbi:class I SAM-dependent methyltransferase [Acidomonas methanolica]|uniref:class I SAM-dependent methyltransferase n=1 Tax=Acidomonas methanolica TaxID=437 RepID=UPI00211A76B8|nr:class I SAM-dependent methyltransferase [Acidomonas methanolica]MCQ9155489.1 methyltransferase [Acidomonas methanolica]